MSSIDDVSIVKYLMGANQIRYEKLDELYSGIDFKNYRCAILLVDGHCIFSKLYHDKKIASVYSSNEPAMIRDLVVAFLNVLGHYRRYMAAHMGLDNDIYVMFNRVKPIYNSKLVDTFNERREIQYDKKDPTTGYTTKALEKAWKFILGLSPYFEGIYCLDNTGIDDFALMSRMDFPKDSLITILTHNSYAMQLIRKNLFVLHSQRDKSYILKPNNFVKDGLLRNVKDKKAPQGLTPSMLPIVWALVGNKDVSVDTLEKGPSIRKTINLLGDLWKVGLLTANTTMTSLLDMLEQTDKSYYDDHLKPQVDEINNRYLALSARLAGLAITTDQLTHINAQIYDVYNQLELEKLNELLVRSQMDPEIISLENLNMSAGMEPEYFYGWN